jgi:hypothetical protein
VWTVERHVERSRADRKIPCRQGQGADRVGVQHWAESNSTDLRETTQFIEQLLDQGLWLSELHATGGSRDGRMSIMSLKHNQLQVYQRGRVYACDGHQGLDLVA